MENEKENPAIDNAETKISDTPAKSNALPSQSKRFNKKKIALTVIVLLIAVSGLAYWFINKDKSNNNNETPVTNTSQEPPKQEEIDPILAKFITPTTGEVWLDAPKPIAKLGLTKQSEDYTDYYEVGKRGDKIIYMSATEELGDSIYLYEKSADGTITAIVRPDSQATYNEQDEQYYSDFFKSKIKINKDIHYDSLSMPAEVDLGGGYKVQKPSFATLGDRKQKYNNSDSSVKSKIEEVKKFGSSTVDKSENFYSDTNLTSISYLLTTPIKTEYSVRFEPLDLDADGYQWSSGNSYNNIGKYKDIARGCGRIGSSVTRSDSTKDVDVLEVGKSAKGVKVYEFKDSNNTIIQKAYDEFKEYVKQDPTIPYASISKEEFIKMHAVILIKDVSGQWLVYVGEDLAPAYGCAKPIVYLYPEKRQDISVRVGADVKISNPLYDPMSGWNVTAWPNGALKHKGQFYESLFWEGPGIGQYPAIEQGVIVPRSQAITTIKSNLKQLGLNQKESADFIEYWQDILPDKPYVRLTWLTTEQMNQLAPLRISPKPDTVIRVFLDFSGLDKPYNIPKQELNSIPRKGFTVIEWGGLSPKKLY